MEEAAMPRFCASCGAQMADTATVCPACGKGTGQSTGGGKAAAPASSAGAGLADNVAGMLAYITIIPAIVFLLIEPYNKRRFVRFHAFQCLFLTAALIAIHLVLTIIPIIGWVISFLVSIGALILWIVLLIKSYQGQMFKLPVIGDLAEKQAGA